MKKNLKKYWRLLEVFWQQALIHRAEMMLWWVIESVPMITMVILWINVYGSGQSLEGFSLNTLITYYILGHLLNSLITAHFELHMVEEILDGSIARFFTRPFPLTHHLVLSVFSWKFLSLFVTLAPITFMMFIIFNELLLLPQPTAILLPLFVILAILIDSMFSLLIVAAAFFLDQGKSLSHAKWIVSGIFKGSMLPLALYPPFLKSLADFLPFRYLYSIPMQVYLGQLSWSAMGWQLLGAVGWIVFLMFLVRLAWHKATLHFTSVGG